MGEIKSTLDLVMARTRHLTLSEDEKQQQRREQGRKHLAGLVQHFADGQIGVDRLLEQTAALRDRFGLDGKAELTQAVRLRLDPDKDNGPWLKVLERIEASASAKVKEALERYRLARRALDRRLSEAALQRLSNIGIAGAAVAPNLAAEPTWKQAVEGLRRDFQRSVTSSPPPSPSA